MREILYGCLIIVYGVLLYVAGRTNFFEAVVIHKIKQITSDLLKASVTTYYDFIRAMSVDEMAEFFTDFSDGNIHYCQDDPEQKCPENYKCSCCIKIWLESEVKDNGK